MLPDPLPPCPISPPERRADGRLARVVHIGAAMIPAYGKLRAARFMSARGVPARLLVPLLRLGERRRGAGAARAWATLPWHPAQRHAWVPVPAITAAAAGSGVAATPAKRPC
ncbi:hypothetical protein [Massilia sp. YMA4]|uniref:hypothetical protein n=1 Tax=Massilia sp. YMA4 TaxID=1593482 RepID=UPI000DD13786|nr:hypothetical protein [Massilia sp. YMA4]AXA91114.1 hypothetical protein DPH57_08045 [Massilia sp. YMA4]